MSLSAKCEILPEKCRSEQPTLNKSLVASKLATYRVYVVTWNVGSKFPDNISLQKLLGLKSDMKGERLPDIYALGFQEVNIQAQQQLFNLFKEDPWTVKAICLLKKFDYVAVKTEQMQGLLLVMFVRRVHVAHLRDIESEFTRTGFGGVWGNKGAVSIRFNIYGASLTFVLAHLAAHDHHMDERVKDFKQIMETHHYHVPGFRTIDDHDYVFWFGDLNFRLMGDDTPRYIRDKVVNDKALEELIKRDQLNYVRQNTQEAFPLLHERNPAFPPTFKFKEGYSEYDLKRRPAWTDRILYAVQPINRQPNTIFNIDQCTYESHSCYNISDHKPVTSEFIIKLFSNYHVPCVEFKDISQWKIGEENLVEYKKPIDFEEQDHDWIGIYHIDYASLNEYVAYEYVKQTDSSCSSLSTDLFCDIDASSRGHLHHHKRKRLNKPTTKTEEIVRLSFADDVKLKHNEEYILIYFQYTGLRGITSVAGISNVFKTKKVTFTTYFGNID